MANISNITLPDNTNHGIRAGAIPYGEVDATSTATAFTATVPGIMELTDGTTIMLRNGQITSASGFTLNINGLGAKPCYNSQATGNDRANPPTAATRDTTIFNVAYTMLFVYSTTIVDGGGWICYRGYNSDTNTVGYLLRNNNGALTVTDTARYYKLYFTSADNSQWVPASVNSTNNATAKRDVNQRPINPFGRIVYTSANTNYTAGSTLAVGTAWSQYALVLGYSFNRTGVALTLTSKKPVYVKCAPQSDGSAIMDATTPIVQALPTTDDGKIYIYLGIAYDATHIELYEEHPVYYHKDGAIRLWNNTAGATIPSATQSATTGISIAAHATGTVTGVQSTTTTASKVTLGTAFSVPNVTSAGSASTWTFEEKSIPNVTSAGSASTWTFEEKSIPNVTSAGSASTWTFEEKTIPNVTAAGSGSYTQGSFSGGSLTMTMDTTDTKKLNITFTAATHGADSHTHTAPTIGTAIKVQSKSGGANGTAPTLGTAIKVQSKSGGGNGTAPTLGTAIKVQSKSGGGNGSAPTLGTAFSIPNVTDVDDVTVPIKNTSASTFVTGTTHTITDNGHTHSI